MKSIKGIIFIIATMSITFLLWFFATAAADISTTERAFHIIAGLALNGLFLVFLLSTRNRVIEKWFNGLENVYVFHKFIAIFSVVAIFIHGRLAESMIAPGTELSITTALGGLAQALFILLILIALFGKKLKYENWRLFHRLMIVPYSIGLYHAYFSSKINLFELSPLGIWMGVISIIGFSSALYSILFYQSTKFKHKGRVTGIKKLNEAVIELELTLESPLEYVNGQFIFIKIFQEGIEKAPHPFSISGGSDQKINVTIKSLGDFTKQLYDLLEVETKVALEGPHGHMKFNEGKKNQVWIAGGIGITPFISYLKDNQSDHFVELFYSYRGEGDIIYKDFLENYQKNNPNFKVNFNDTSTMKRLDFNEYSVKDETSIFMCGPEKMINTYAKVFKEKDKNVDLTFEAFKFRD